MDSANPVTGQQAHPTVPSAPVDTWRGTFMPPAVPPVRPSRPPRDRMWFRQITLRLLRDPFTRGFRRQVEYAAVGLLSRFPALSYVVAVTVGFGMSMSFAGMLVGLSLLMVSLRGAGGSARFIAAWPTGCWGSRSAAASAAPGAWRLRPGPGGPDRSCRLAGVPTAVQLLFSVASAICMIYLLLGSFPLTFPIWWEILHVHHVVP